jgi:serine/threonine-protein kinase
MLIGRFRLVHWLGSGGTGDVWLAEDEVLGRRVAVKLPHPDLVRDEHVRREFLREARAGSMLEHPGIATVYDVGDSSCGPFIAMAYVDGPSLRDLVREAPVPLTEAVPWIAAAADALAHAHARELVHGDVSPGNLMLDCDGRLKIVDFGLARSLAPGVETTRSHVLGTYPYMAPEVLRGVVPDLRSDLYGLGVVLYQLLTGELPYEGRTPGAYVGAVLEGRVRDPRALNGAIPEAIKAVVLRALATRPEDRPAGASDFARSLRAALGTHTAISSARPAAESRRRTATAPRARSSETDDRPRLETESATRALIEARLLQAEAFLRRPDQEAAMDAAIRALESLRSLSPDDPRILGALARASLFKGQLARDSAWEDRAMEHVERGRAVAPDDPAIMLAAADLERIQGRHEEALALYARVLAVDPGAVDAHVGASWAHERRGELDGAEAAARAAIAADPNDWRGHSRLGGFLMNRGAFERAIEAWKRVVEIAPEHARGWSSYGGALFQVGRFEDALDAFERSIRLQPTAHASANAGAAQFYLGRYVESLQHYERAIALAPSDARAWGNFACAAEHVPGMEERVRDAFDRASMLMREQVARHPDDAQSWSMLANWLAHNGRLDEARSALAMALEHAHGEAFRLERIADTHELLGEDDVAIAIYRERVLRGLSLRQLEVDPTLSRLRSTPGWSRVVEAAADSNALGARSAASSRLSPPEP